MVGSPLITIMPRFILAGSSAQLEIPMKATLSSRATIYMKCGISNSIQLTTDFMSFAEGSGTHMYYTQAK